jgi:uncharacterized membrane protein
MRIGSKSGLNDVMRIYLSEFTLKLKTKFKRRNRIMAKKKSKTAHAKSTAPNTASQKAAHDKSASKKAAVLGTEKKARLPLILVILCVVLAAGGAYFYVNVNNPGGATTATANVSQVVSGSEVIFPVKLFADGKARHFEHKDGEFTIKYFVLKSSDGVIRAAFDACDVCWPSGKGYYQDGDVMVCRNCGRRFVSVKVNEVKGGCNPAPLTRTVKGDNLVIQVEDILKGKPYFNFSGKA